VAPAISRIFAPAVVSTDILPARWLKALADAQRLPFAAASFDNIAMFDVLHHLDRPRMFLQEAVLRRGGRIVMVEPAITPLSGLLYRNFHPEPVIMSAARCLTGRSIRCRMPSRQQAAVRIQPAWRSGAVRATARQCTPSADGWRVVLKPIVSCRKTKVGNRWKWTLRRLLMRTGWW